MPSLSGPFKTVRDSGRLRLDYVGNRKFPAAVDALAQRFDIEQLARRVLDLNRDNSWSALLRLHHSVFAATSQYFHGRGACFVPLPLTTRMISSPGAYYDRKQVSYSIDVKPVTLDWFEEKRPIFLSESSQIYLELALAQLEVNEVFSICSSFRNEASDPLHLAEFHHIEYEGRLDHLDMEQVGVGLLAAVARGMVGCESDLAMFLEPGELRALADFAEKPRVEPVDLVEALDALYRDTKDDRYRQFTLENTLGPAEETRLTEIYGTAVALRKFPLMEVPFYHARVEASSPATAKNSDILWPGYNEIIGSGERISTLEELREKGRLFEIPEQDYQPYLQTRELPGYRTTSGFGLGWERLVQAMLKMPCIWTAMPFPRLSGAMVN
jgi:asparaginyl-tRNA synthetase